MRCRGLLALLLLGACDRGGSDPPLVAPPEDRQTVDLGDAPTLGPDDATVTIVMFGDFACSYCSVGLTRMKTEVLPLYPDDVRLAFKHFPLPQHPSSHLAAEAARYAQDAGKFWEYADLLMANQNAQAKEDLQTYAGQVGIDPVALGVALDDGTYVAAIDADEEQGTALGLQGTPTFFINGRAAAGVLPVSVYTDAIDEELALAGK
jgi:protein-disulfide isomerase